MISAADPTRAVDGTDDENAIVDIGAFERQPSDNIAPTADVGGNLSTSTLSSTMLDGSGSFDEAVVQLLRTSRDVEPRAKPDNLG